MPERAEYDRSMASSRGLSGPVQKQTDEENAKRKKERIAELEKEQKQPGFQAGGPIAEEGRKKRYGANEAELMDLRGVPNAQMVEALLGQSRKSSMGDLMGPGMETAESAIPTRGMATIIPSREAIKQIAKTRTVRDASVVAQSHVETGRTPDELRKGAQAPTPRTPTTPPDGGQPTAPEAATPQSMYGGTAPKDFGRVSAINVTGPTGKTRTIYGGTTELAPRVEKGEGSWAKKPAGGRAEESRGVVSAPGGGTFYGGAGGKPGDALSRAIDAAATSDQPFSQKLEYAMGPAMDKLSDPIQRAYYREYLDRRIEEEKNKELTDAERAAKEAQLLYTEKQASLDPLAVARLQAMSRWGGENIKAESDAAKQTMALRVSDWLSKLYSQARTPEEQHRVEMLMRLYAAMMAGNAIPGSFEGLFGGMFGTPTPGAAPAATGPVK
jgi:hypothetical protein